MVTINVITSNSRESTNIVLNVNAKKMINNMKKYVTIVNINIIAKKEQMLINHLLIRNFK